MKTLDWELKSTNHYNFIPLMYYSEIKKHVNTIGLQNYGAHLKGFTFLLARKIKASLLIGLKFNSENGKKYLIGKVIPLLVYGSVQPEARTMNFMSEFWQHLDKR